VRVTGLFGVVFLCYSYQLFIAVPTIEQEKDIMQIWDLPLRLFHWGLVVAVIGAIASAKLEILWLHERFGLAVMGLVGFRLVWGGYGGHYARFGQFLVVPRRALAGIKGLLRPDTARPHAGHSAAGGYAVLGLLAVTGGMALSGSFSHDDVLFEGPLAHLLPQVSATATSLHHIGEKILFLMIVLHLAAILVYRVVKRRHLTSVMVRGHVAPDGNLLGPDGSISLARCIAGILGLVIFVGGAQALSLLRPVLF